MKKLLIILIVVLSVNGFGQKPTQFGINISPGIRLVSSKIDGTGLRSFQRGYGFNTGFPVKIWVNEFTAFNTGLDFEFSSFDIIENQILVSSFRISSLHLPLMFNLHLSGNFYAMLGSGVSYNLSVTDLNIQNGSQLNGSSNRIQPYIGLGAASLAEKNFGSIEVGFLGRMQLLNLWKSDFIQFQGYTQRLISLDLIFRYYF